MHLFLVRHAESENNARPEHERVEDPSITPRGVEQAAHLAQWLRTLLPHRLITSPFRRALQTAAPAANSLDCHTEVWCDIFEQGGCYRGWTTENIAGANGMSPQEALALVPKALMPTPWSELGWWGGKPKESDAEASARAIAVRRKFESLFDDLASEQRVVAITHADFQRVLLHTLLQESDLDARKLGPICNAGVTYLQWTNARWVLHWFNAVTHLPHSLITGAKG